MYGLINKAIQCYVEETYGVDKWEHLKQTASCDVDFFISMDSYDDSISYNLIKAVPEVLGVSPVHFLENIGEFWVSYVGNGDYKEIFKMAGSDFVFFIQNINNMHSRIMAIIPNLVPPIFICKNITKNSMVVDYFSKREGLAPMVVGLFKGLAVWFKLEMKIEWGIKKTEKINYDQFYIEFTPGKTI